MIDVYTEIFYWKIFLRRKFSAVTALKVGIKINLNKIKINNKNKIKNKINLNKIKNKIKK